MNDYRKFNFDEISSLNLKNKKLYLYLVFIDTFKIVKEEVEFIGTDEISLIQYIGRISNRGNYTGSWKKGKYLIAFGYSVI